MQNSKLSSSKGVKVPQFTLKELKIDVVVVMPVHVTKDSIDKLDIKIS